MYSRLIQVPLQLKGFFQMHERFLISHVTCHMNIDRWCCSVFRKVAGRVTGQVPARWPLDCTDTARWPVLVCGGSKPSLDGAPPKQQRASSGFRGFLIYGWYFLKAVCWYTILKTGSATLVTRGGTLGGTGPFPIYIHCGFPFSRQIFPIVSRLIFFLFSI